MPANKIHYLIAMVSFVVAVAIICLIGMFTYHLMGGQRQIIFPIIAALFLAVVTPLMIIAIRHQVRRSRIKLIDMFARNFLFGRYDNVADLDGGAKQAAASAQQKRNDNISFEFVRDKYYVDLDIPPGREPTLDDVPRFPMLLHADWMLLLCALPFMVICWFGTYLIFSPVIEVIKSSPCGMIGSWLWASMLSVGGLGQGIYVETAFEHWHTNTLTVALFAFAGAYFYSLRLMLRAVAVFDLSPVTFLRAFVHVVMAMLLAVVVYRGIPTQTITDSARKVATWVGVESRPQDTARGSPQNPQGSEAPLAADGRGVQTGFSRQADSGIRQTLPTHPGTMSLRNLVPGSPECVEKVEQYKFDLEQYNKAIGKQSEPQKLPAGTEDPGNGVYPLWLLVAFAFGFLPDAALQYLLQRGGVTFKARFNELENYTKLIPLTVLDGIDHFIAFRLEESNIFDVQNLATSNPIMLHIESPFGIYETIDWVAQAQLCTVVGPERFLLLKGLNIRTVFDLERAVCPVYRSNTDGTPELQPDGPRTLPDTALTLAIGRILFANSTREHDVWARLAASRNGRRMPFVDPPDADLVGMTRAVVTLIIDDLHVHRLRQIWRNIALRLGRENAFL